MRVVRSGRAKRIALRVDPAKGDVCLVIPPRASERKAWEFAQKNVAWILAQKKRVAEPVSFVNGAQIPVFGITREIVVEPATTRTTDITLTDTQIIVRTRRENPANNIKQYLYKLLEETVRPMAMEKAARIGREVTAIDLRDTRTRWGSCGHDGRVMLCWRLVFAPIDVIDYVVGHEIAHLEHMNHGDDFWALCEELSDNFEARHWLKTNGDSLLRYDA